ncbi:MAG: hypothetical protein IPK74_11285 [Deltaproteobacteria bacterium]|nr:hypothetical protein [Deltaproteobacteria bacterium]
MVERGSIWTLLGATLCALACGADVEPSLGAEASSSASIDPSAGTSSDQASSSSNGGDSSSGSSTTSGAEGSSGESGVGTASSSGEPSCEDCRCLDTGAALAVACDPTAVPSGDGQHQWGSSYAGWTSQGGGIAFAQRLRIVQPAVRSFHTHTFDLSGASGGYIGLQTTDIAPDGTIASHVRFSIWDTLEADGPGCTPFGGEGIGWTCVIDPYPIDFGVMYTLSVTRGDAESDGTWWEATVRNDETCAVQTIGRIKVAHAGEPRWISSSYNFSEYFGQRAVDCHAVPQSIAEWTAPEVTHEDDQVVADVFASFTKAEPGTPCGEAGVDASGEVAMLDDTTVYRMVNGSVPTCH